MLALLKGGSVGWILTALVVHFVPGISVDVQFFWLAAAAACALAASNFKE
jgi:hypothetical protein